MSRLMFKLTELLDIGISHQCRELAGGSASQKYEGHPPEISVSGPRTRIRDGLVLEGVRGRKWLKWRGEKIDKVCDRVLRECWEASSRPDFPCQNRVLAQGKPRLANGGSGQEEDDRPLARPILAPPQCPDYGT